MRRLLPVTLVAVLAAACGETAGQEIGPAAEIPANGEAMGATPAAVAHVLASPDGVELVAASGDTTRVSDQPAAMAFGVRGGLVAFQGAGGSGDLYPPQAAGPVELWSEGEVSELPSDPKADGVRLLEVGIVDGTPIAVIAEEFDVSSENPRDQLTLIDLRDLSRTIVAPEQPSWGASYGAARLLPDGDIVALRQQSVVTRLARWSVGADEPMWNVEVAVDRNVELVVVDEEILVLESSYNARRGFGPDLKLTPHDPATGDPGAAELSRTRDPDGALDTGVFCSDWSSPNELVCARSGGSPVVVSLDDGSFEELPGAPGAIPTLVRTQ